jgi:hypothetical protein
MRLRILNDSEGRVLAVERIHPSRTTFRGREESGTLLSDRSQALREIEVFPNPSETLLQFLSRSRILE